jgi:hypothetical protein
VLIKASLQPIATVAARSTNALPQAIAGLPNVIFARTQALELAQLKGISLNSDLAQSV